MRFSNRQNRHPIASCRKGAMRVSKRTVVRAAWVSRNATGALSEWSILKAFPSIIWGSLRENLH
jgi:hypothetical protein